MRAACLFPTLHERVNLVGRERRQVATHVDTHISEQLDETPAVDSEFCREIMDPRFPH